MPVTIQPTTLKYKNGNTFSTVDCLQGPQGPSGEGVPEGGTAGQFLKKSSSTDYDTEWTNDPTTSVKQNIAFVEDGDTATQSIAAGQYVIWKGSLTKANTAIPAGGTLSLTNLDTVSNGVANSLNTNIVSLEKSKAGYTTTNNFINTSINFTVANSCNYMVFVVGSSPDRGAAALVFVNSSGTPYVTPIATTGADITITTSKNTITIANANTTNGARATLIDLTRRT